MIYDEIDKKTANVYGIFGHLGGGKTLTAVEIALGFLRDGHTVVSNIALFNLTSEEQSHYIHLSEDLETVDFFALPQGAPRGSDDTNRVCIILDEVAEFFDQFSSTSPLVRNFMSWLRHSSKRGQFVFLVIQNKEYMAKSLRILVYKWIYVIDMYQIRMPLFKIRPPFLGGFCARRIYDRLGNPLTNGLLLVDKKVIGYHYNTSQMLSRSHKAEFDKVVVKPPFPHRRKLWIISLAWIVFIFLVW